MLDMFGRLSDVLGQFRILSDGFLMVVGWFGTRFKNKTKKVQKKTRPITLNARNESN